MKNKNRDKINTPHIQMHDRSLSRHFKVSGGVINRKENQFYATTISDIYLNVIVRNLNAKIIVWNLVLS
jgi:hypothetical protein